MYGLGVHMYFQSSFNIFDCVVSMNQWHKTFSMPVQSYLFKNSVRTNDPTLCPSAKLPYAPKYDEKPCWKAAHFHKAT